MNKIEELQQWKDILEMKQIKLEKEIEQLKNDKRHLQSQILLLQLVKGEKSG